MGHSESVNARNQRTTHRVMEPEIIGDAILAKVFQGTPLQGRRGNPNSTLTAFHHTQNMTSRKYCETFVRSRRRISTAVGTCSVRSCNPITVT